MVSDVIGQCQKWELHCPVYFYKGAHEYPVLDRRPGSNDLELDFRSVCAVSCARKKLPAPLSQLSTAALLIRDALFELNCLFNVTINDISVIYVTAHRCAGGPKKKYDLRSGSQRHRHFVGFFNPGRFTRVPSVILYIMNTWTRVSPHPVI